MVPPLFSTFEFVPGSGGAPEALAARVAGVAGGRVAVMGVTDIDLLAALARRFERVDAFDPSRSQLRRAREALGDDARIGLYAEDLRDVDVHDDPDVVLLPSLTWRLLVLAEGRALMLRSLRSSLAAGGRLCLDIERMPSDGGQSGDWRWRRDPQRRLVQIAHDEIPIGLELADLTPEQALDEVRAVGFQLARTEDAETGEAFGALSRRLFAVASTRA